MITPSLEACDHPDREPQAAAADIAAAYAQTLLRDLGFAETELRRRALPGSDAQLWRDCGLQSVSYRQSIPPLPLASLAEGCVWALNSLLPQPLTWRGDRCRG